MRCLWVTSEFQDIIPLADLGTKNEVYITPSWDVNPLASINGKATVVSAESFKTKYPSGKVPRSSKDYGTIFICRRGCSTRTATYTDEFIWEEKYSGAEDLHDLIDFVKSQTKPTRKRKRNVDDPAIDVSCQNSSRCQVDVDRFSTIQPTTIQRQSPVHPARKPNLHLSPPLPRLPNAHLRSNTLRRPTRGS